NKDEIFRALLEMCRHGGVTYTIFTRFYPTSKAIQIVLVGQRKVVPVSTLSQAPHFTNTFPRANFECGISFIIVGIGLNSNANRLGAAIIDFDGNATPSVIVFQTGT